MHVRNLMKALALALALCLAAPCAKAEEKNVLRVVSHRTWSEHVAYIGRSTSYSFRYWGNTLMRYDYTEAYQCELAASYEWADEKTLVFHLRGGVYFQDGRPLTASDVAFTFQLHLDAQTGYNNNVWAFLGSVEALDAQTVAFHMHTVSPRLWDMFFDVAILSKAGYEAGPQDYMALPYGTGGWKMTYANPVTYEMRFERWTDSWVWDGYYPAASNLDEIIITQQSEAAARVAALRAGEADAIMQVNVDAIDILESEGFHMHKEAAVNYNMLGFNCREGMPTHDINLRKAISYAIDRQAIVDALLGGVNYVYTWPCRDTFMGYQDVNVYEYDPEKAKGYLAQSSYGGETLEMIVCVNYIVSAAECARAIATYLESVGIQVHVSLMDSAAFTQREFAGDYDINFIDLGGSAAENAKFVWEIFGHDQFATGYPEGISTRLRGLADQLDATMEPAGQLALRTALYAEMAEQYAPYIFLWGDATYNACAENITNVNWQPTIMYQYYQYASKD